MQCVAVFPGVNSTGAQTQKQNGIVGPELKNKIASKFVDKMRVLGFCLDDIKDVVFRLSTIGSVYFVTVLYIIKKDGFKMLSV